MVQIKRKKGQENALLRVGAPRRSQPSLSCLDLAARAREREEIAVELTTFAPVRPCPRAAAALPLPLDKAAPLRSILDYGGSMRERKRRTEEPNPSISR